jgi:hypothetical protein
MGSAVPARGRGENEGIVSIRKNEFPDLAAYLSIGFLVYPYLGQGGNREGIQMGDTTRGTLSVSRQTLTRCLEPDWEDR